MKTILTFLFISFSFFLKAQFGDLADVEFSVEKDKGNIYELSFKMKLKKMPTCCCSAAAVLLLLPAAATLRCSRY